MNVPVPVSMVQQQPPPYTSQDVSNNYFHLAYQSTIKAIYTYSSCMNNIWVGIGQFENKADLF